LTKPLKITVFVQCFENKTGIKTTVFFAK